MKEKDILLSDDENNNLFIWNLKTFQCENKFIDIECIQKGPIFQKHAIFQIDNERVIIGGSSVCTIINIAKSEIEAEKNKAREDLRSEVVSLAVAGAEKIINEKIDFKADEALLKKIADSL